MYRHTLRMKRATVLTPPAILNTHTHIDHPHIQKEIAAHLQFPDQRGAASSYPPPRFCKGNYFRLAFGRSLFIVCICIPRPNGCHSTQTNEPPTTTGPSPFTRLVYPLPEAAGLGVHATVDLGGQTRFGPDVEWVDDPGKGKGREGEGNERKGVKRMTGG